MPVGWGEYGIMQYEISFLHTDPHQASPVSLSLLHNFLPFNFNEILLMFHKICWTHFPLLCLPPPYLPALVLLPSSLLCLETTQPADPFSWEMLLIRLLLH
jgi:hypothetical protein